VGTRLGFKKPLVRVLPSRPFPTYNTCNAGITILPVLSASTPRLHLSEGQARALMARIQDAGTEVVKVSVAYQAPHERERT
jgi:hypothetical protein